MKKWNVVLEEARESAKEKAARIERIGDPRFSMKPDFGRQSQLAIDLVHRERGTKKEMLEEKLRLEFIKWYLEDPQWRGVSWTEDVENGFPFETRDYTVAPKAVWGFLIRNAEAIRSLLAEFPFED